MGAPGGVVPLRVLIVEDSPADAELAVMELRRARLAPEATRVETRAALIEALATGAWDVVIADYRLPGWRGLDALKIVQEREIDVPFIIVSGNIGEEKAIEAMKAGAHDYVLKRNLARLGPAVTRELRELEIRRERRQALADLEQMARRSAFLAEAGRKLAASLNYEETLQAAARIALPEMADWCLLVVPEAGLGLRAELRHVDPALEALGRDHLARHPLDPDVARGAVQVMRSGSALVSKPDDVLCTVAPDADGAVVERLGHAASLSVALVTHGPPIGALTLVRTSAPFQPDHLGFVQDLASRIAMALDNARLYRQAREAIRVRDEFLSVASHELNTPLATLTLQLDEAFLHDRGPVSPDRQQGLERLQRQLARLAHLVANLLDVSRLTARRLTLERSSVDLAATARDVADQLAPELARAGCSVRLEAPAPVVGHWDPLRVAQVVTNLLSNAYKYGAGKPIDVSVEAREERARLTVRDHGIGIPLDDQERIFERFERAVSASNYGGLGLGLYITRQVVEAHGGTIAVHSAPAAGATFVVELPLTGPGEKVAEG
jgi:signal transduction histidine kinase/DNA-binding NarL/FixJ family response regulator